MNMIDLPALKEILWHRMRNDLKLLVPWFADNDLLLCPTCCRPLRFDEFSLEHIIPKQALAYDPSDVRVAIPQNERSGMTLLCQSSRIPSFLNAPDFRTFWTFNWRIWWTKRQLGMARPHQRCPQNRFPAPQDSHSEYLSIHICTYGCK